MRRIAHALFSSIFCLTLFFGSVGCATVVSNLPIVIAAVTDGIMVLDAIKSFVDAYFKLRPNIELQAQVDAAMIRTRMALNAALRIAHGAEKLDQAKIDEAFVQFRAAYTDLLALLAPLGVNEGPSLRTVPGGGGLIVPEPLALTLKAK